MKKILNLLKIKFSVDRKILEEKSKYIVRVIVERSNEILDFFVEGSAGQIFYKNRYMGVEEFIFELYCNLREDVKYIEIRYERLK